MTKQEFIEDKVRQITYHLTDKDKQKDKYHIFYGYTIESIQEVMEKIDWTNQENFIFLLSQHLEDENLINFTLEEKSNYDESWFEAITYLGIVEGADKPVIWDSQVLVESCESIEELIKIMAELEYDIQHQFHKSV